MQNPKVHSKGQRNDARNGGARIAQPATLPHDSATGNAPVRDMTRTGGIVTQQVGWATDGSGRYRSVSSFSQATRRPDPITGVSGPGPLNPDSIRQEK